MAVTTQWPIRFLRPELIQARVAQRAAPAQMTHVEPRAGFRQMPRRIRRAGGAARSDVRVQVVADVFEVPVEISNGTEWGAPEAAFRASGAAGKEIGPQPTPKADR
jgi:sugar (pentulose or hexulose) kinase